MTHTYKVSGTVDANNTPILFCEKCAHFSNQPPKDCTSVPVVVIATPTNPCSKAGCRAPAKRRCDGNVRNQEQCGKDFCEDHVQFIQSINKQKSCYQCESCISDQINSDRQKEIARRIARSKDQRCACCLAGILIPCMCLIFPCPVFYPLGCCLFHDCCSCRCYPCTVDVETCNCKQCIKSETDPNWDPR